MSPGTRALKRWHRKHSPGRSFKATVAVILDLPPIDPAVGRLNAAAHRWLDRKGGKNAAGGEVRRG